MPELTLSLRGKKQGGGEQVATRVLKRMKKNFSQTAGLRPPKGLLPVKERILRSWEDG